MIVTTKTISVPFLPEHSHIAEDITNQSLSSSGSPTFQSINTKFIQLEANISNPEFQEGKIFYNQEKHVFSYFNDLPEMSFHLGRQLLIRVKNVSGKTLYKGQVVYPYGVQDGNVLIDLANAKDFNKYRLVSVLANTLLNEAIMEELGEGLYVYDFEGAQELEEYAVKCDGGESLNYTERYVWDGGEIAIAKIKGGYIS